MESPPVLPMAGLVVPKGGKQADRQAGEIGI